ELPTLLCHVLSPPFWTSILWGPLSENFRAPQIVSGWTTKDGKPYFVNITEFALSLGCAAERVEDPSQLEGAVRRAFNTNGPVVIEAMSAHELPWTEMHPTGWWDITVPAYHGATRDEYVVQRGF
ncbi:thiamine pyrophosphate-dependent enzyme, partial [Streptomyces sp. NPDC058297]|uniref:thiamine pyrophosphate-dependent enzyme n=1 Tax=Streptomyces sp. NPDC058297 TaxID=3346433 RepID=UPI0036E2AD69